MTVTATKTTVPSPTEEKSSPFPDGGPPAELLPTQCLVCADDDAEPLAVGQDFAFGSSGETYLAMRCNGCGLVYLNPFPARAGVDPADLPPRKLPRKVIRACRGLGPSARVLHGSRLEELDGASGSYHAVLLTDVLERVSDPLRMLTAARTLLHPGGLVLVTTPNTESVVSRVFRGRHWSGYNFPRHRNLFCPGAMMRAAKIAGLEVVSVKTIATPDTWVQSLQNVAYDWTFPNWTITALHRASRITFAVGAVIEWLQQFRGKGGALFVTLRAPLT